MIDLNNQDIVRNIIRHSSPPAPHLRLKELEGELGSAKGNISDLDAEKAALLAKIAELEVCLSPPPPPP